jgi:DNA-binding NarL/FixJ family response regulator
MTRIFLVDDHAVVRGGLTRLLDAVPGVEVVGTAANGAEAVAGVAVCSPDLVVMDLSLPVLDGVEATRQILANNQQIRVVVLTSFSDRQRILDAIDVGAVGYLLKDASPDELVRGIVAAADGGAPLSPIAASVIVSARRQRGSIDDLSRREREVVVLVTAGLTNGQIAQRLGLSEKTVKVHLGRAFQRIGVTDRRQAAQWAELHGLSAQTAAKPQVPAERDEQGAGGPMVSEGWGARRSA